MCGQTRVCRIHEHRSSQIIQCSLIDPVLHPVSNCETRKGAMVRVVAPEAFRFRNRWSGVNCEGSPGNLDCDFVPRCFALTGISAAKISIRPRACKARPPAASAKSESRFVSSRYLLSGSPTPAPSYRPRPSHPVGFPFLSLSGNSIIPTVLKLLYFKT